MRTDIWENMISLNSHENPEFSVLAPAAEWRGKEDISRWLKEKDLGIEQAVKNDTWPLPEIKDREGYYGERHFGYWASGLLDMRNLLGACKKYDVKPEKYLDFGCASGRVIRHFACNVPSTKVYGCDINRKHIDWINRYLPENIIAFQNHSIPSLPLPENSFDLISAFSVYTHIEAFESAWLLEMERILKPGGLIWATIHTEKTWEELGEGWPLYNALKNHPEFKAIPKGSPLPGERVVFRWRTDRSYSSNVFYTMDYIRKTWGRIFEVLEFRRRCPVFQDVVILRKRG